VPDPALEIDRYFKGSSDGWHLQFWSAVSLAGLFKKGGGRMGEHPPGVVLACFLGNLGAL